MSDMTTSLPQFLPNAAATRRVAISSRPLRLCLALSIGAVGLYGVLSDRQYVSTTNAVVSAYLLDVRTPIGGTLRDVPATAGDDVDAGALLGRVGNALMDRGHLDDLRITEGVAQSRADALARERASLEGVRRGMLQRAALHTEATSRRMEQQVDEASTVLEARKATLAEATLELDRGRKLVGWGVISRAAFDKLVATQQVSADETRAQGATLAAAQTELEAARHGVLSEPGTNNDLAYSAQRADEVTIKLAENASELEAARAQAREAHRAVDAESRRSSLLGSSEVRAPSSGRIWKLNAINGEHVEADAPVVSIVDCHRQFVLAQVPQDRVSTLVLNSKAEVKLTGESIARTGRVMTVSGDSRTHLDAKLAAAPVNESKDDLATIVIRLDSAPEKIGTNAACLVGRTARVRIPTQPTNLLSLWLSQRL